MSVAILRVRVEAEIERLIGLLDVIDGDPDLEDNADDEPSIGSAWRFVGGQVLYDCELDESDFEPRGARIAGGGYHT